MVTVTDVNDVTPRIVAPSAQEIVVLPSAADTRVATVTATDADAGLAGRVLFTIQQTSPQFYVISDGKKRKRQRFDLGGASDLRTS